MNTQQIRFGALLRKPVGELLSERRANSFYGAIALVTLLISACVGGGDEPTRSAFRTVGAAHASADPGKGPEGRPANAADPQVFSSPYQPSAEEYRAMALAEYVEPF